MFKYYGYSPIDGEIINLITEPTDPDDFFNCDCKKIERVSVFNNGEMRIVQLEPLIKRDEDEITTGGEGVIYRDANDHNLVIKIYNQENRNKFKEQKIKFLCENKLTNAQLAWPISPVYDETGKIFLGYSMRYVGKSKDLSMLCDENFEGYTKQEFLDVLKQCVELIDFLHKNGIVYGDIHQNQFLVDNNKRVHLVDLDCIQIDKFPGLTCFAGYEVPERLNDFVVNNPEYQEADSIRAPKIAAELYVGSLRDYYRSFDNDNYCLAIMLYKVFLEHTSQDEQSIFDYRDINHNKVNEIKTRVDGRILYTNSDNEFNGTVNKTKFAWWSNLPSFFKEAFIKTFSKSSYNYHVDTQRWIKLLDRYIELLSNPNANISKEIYPSDIVDFKTVEFKCTDEFDGLGFSIKGAIKVALSKYFKKYNYLLQGGNQNEYLSAIVSGLKQYPKISYKNIEADLLFNKGVCTKVLLIVE